MRQRTRQRLLVAAGIGLTAGLFAYAHLALIEPRTLGFDFTWPWRAARALLAHRDPYATITPTGAFPFDNYFKYPLPAAIVAVPVAWMSAATAAAAFSGVSAAMLAWGLTRDGWHRLWILASAPFATTLESGQWSTLLMAGALLPALSWVAVCKPTVGLAVFVYRPNWWAAIGGGVLLLASFVVQPSWVGGWVSSVRADPAHAYVSVVSLTGGPLVLLALLRWRRPEARYLAALAVVPQIMTFYTAFLPMLVAETKRESQVMAILSFLAWFGWTWELGDAPAVQHAPIYAAYWILALLFAPALVMIMRRPNVDTLHNLRGAANETTYRTDTNAAQI